MIKQRLKQFIAFQKISVNEFCLKNELSNSYFNNDSAVGSDKLLNIFRNFPQLNMDWVITGRGSMLLIDELPIPNFIKNNFYYLLSTLEYNNFQTFASLTGIDFIKTGLIFKKNEWPTMEEIKKVALYFNHPVDEILHIDMKERYENRDEESLSLVAEGSVKYGIDYKEKFLSLQAKLKALTIEAEDKKTGTGD